MTSVKVNKICAFIKIRHMVSKVRYYKKKITSLKYRGMTKKDVSLSGYCTVTLNMYLCMYSTVNTFNYNNKFHIFPF